jgi:hypothetical protein
MRNLRSDALVKWASICACRRSIWISIAYIFGFDLSYVMFSLIYTAGVKPSLLNVVDICEGMPISSIFTLYAMIKSISTMLCEEHGVLSYMWLVTASVRVSRHFVDFTFCNRRPFLKPLNKYSYYFMDMYMLVIVFALFWLMDVIQCTSTSFHWEKLKLFSTCVYDPGRLTANGFEYIYVYIYVSRHGRRLGHSWALWWAQAWVL